MGKKRRGNPARQQIKNPLPKWIDKPEVSGYYWYYEPCQQDFPAMMVIVEVEDNGDIWILPEGGEEDLPWSHFAPLKPKFCGPMEVPLTPYFTEGLSRNSAVSAIWAYDADRQVMRHLRNHVEVDLEKDNLSGWMVWLRDQNWFHTYVEEDFLEMCEKYAPKGWMR